VGCCKYRISLACVKVTTLEYSSVTGPRVGRCKAKVISKLLAEDYAVGLSGTGCMARKSVMNRLE
jgi:hypothetical protein